LLEGHVMWECRTFIQRISSQRNFFRDHYDLIDKFNANTRSVILETWIHLSMSDSSIDIFNCRYVFGSFVLVGINAAVSIICIIVLSRFSLKSNKNKTSLFADRQKVRSFRG
jgi:hypothetical protein